MNDTIGIYIALTVAYFCSYLIGLHIGKRHSNHENEIEIAKYRIDMEWKYIQRLHDEEREEKRRKNENQ